VWRPDFVKNWHHCFRGLTHEGFGNGKLDTGDFVVHGIDGKGQFSVPDFVRGMNFRPGLTGNVQHALDDEGKRMLR
jgi:hypothetical protein